MLERKICIDAGHGGRDPGAVSNGLKEKDISLKVALKLAAYLESLNFKVILTRKKDIFVDLDERANIANRSKADLFISIHCNSHNSNAYGFETFYYPTAIGGKVLANNIQNSILNDRRLYQYEKSNVNRGIKTARFTVLENTSMEAVLVEMGFISNYIDSQILKNNTSGFARAIANGVLKYYNLKPITDIESEAIKNRENMTLESTQSDEVHWAEYFYDEVNEKARACNTEQISEKRFNDYITRGEAIRLTHLAIEIREYNDLEKKKKK